MKTSVKRRAKNCIRGTVLLACFIAVWYVASCFTQPLFIPAPATVWEAIVGLAETGQLQKGLAYSFLRITGASALSIFFHPDYTVGFGITPNRAFYARGLYRQSGISPCPEDTFIQLFPRNYNINHFWKQ